MMKKQLLGVGINDVSLKEAIEIVEGWLQHSGQHYIVTPNPEFLVDAYNDSDFKEILNRAHLSIPDGKGLRIGSDIVCNTPGIDLMEEIIKMSSEKAFTTGFLGGRDQVAEKTVECLLKKYKNLKVNYISEEPTKIPRLDILFVAFGHSKQEKWIARNLDKIPVKVAMGVGGSFDFLSGKIQRAPSIVRQLGLEWLFRLFLQPWRIKRQLKLFKYLWLVLHSK